MIYLTAVIKLALVNYLFTTMAYFAKSFYIDTFFHILHQLSCILKLVQHTVNLGVIYG